MTTAAKTKRRNALSVKANGHQSINEKVFVNLTETNAESVAEDSKTKTRIFWSDDEKTLAKLATARQRLLAPKDSKVSTVNAGIDWLVDQGFMRHSRKRVFTTTDQVKEFVDGATDIITKLTYPAVDAIINALKSPSHEIVIPNREPMKEILVLELEKKIEPVNQQVGLALYADHEIAAEHYKREMQRIEFYERMRGPSRVVEQEVHQMIDRKRKVIIVGLEPDHEEAKKVLEATTTANVKVTFLPPSSSIPLPESGFDMILLPTMHSWYDLMVKRYGEKRIKKKPAEAAGLISDIWAISSRQDQR